MDASARVNDLIVVASRLVALMEQEIATLREMKVGEIRDLQPEKEQLVNAYMEHGRALDREPDELAAVAPAIKQVLQDTLQRFRAVVGESERTLRAAHQANGRLVRAIVDAVTAKQAEAATYTEAGTLNRRASGAPRRPTPLSINRRL